MQCARPISPFSPAEFLSSLHCGGSKDTTIYLFTRQAISCTTHPPSDVMFQAVEVGETACRHRQQAVGSYAIR